jgi:hypothetical protein
MARVAGPTVTAEIPCAQRLITGGYTPQHQTLSLSPASTGINAAYQVPLPPLHAEHVAADIETSKSASGCDRAPTEADIPASRKEMGVSRADAVLLQANDESHGEHVLQNQ